MVIKLRRKAQPGSASRDQRRERSSLIFRHGGKYEYIRAGDLFRHKNGGPVEELAQVLSLYADRNNIPHVRFELSLRRNELGVQGGPRILALQSFRRHFRERVEALS